MRMNRPVLSGVFGLLMTLVMLLCMFPGVNCFSADAASAPDKPAARELVTPTGDNEARIIKTADSDKS